MVNVATLEGMPLDFKTPFDELRELRTLLTTKQIAELTGLRRETISRARPDSRFQRRTEKALGDLYLVVTRMRTVADDDLGQIAAVLRRPQAALHGLSIAELLKEGRVDEVLEQLGAPEPTDPVPLPHSRPGEPPDDAAETFLAADPQLAALLPEIEAKVREHFAPTEGIERGIIEDFEGEPGDRSGDVFYLRVLNDLSLDANVKRLITFLEQERQLLSPVHSRVTIGFL
jgi:hypothetical protein